VPPLLILDTNYLCHRAFHTMPELSNEDIGTGAVFGVLRDIVTLQTEFATGRTVFTFDYGGRGLRCNLSPTYKSSRTERYAEEDEAQQERRRNFRAQVRELRSSYLPDIGFRNVFAAKGYEADDLIAMVAAGVTEDDEAIIISADEDLWQLLRPNVWHYNPTTRHATTYEKFRAKWGIDPFQWANVKAWCGCETDDVEGVEGVGPVTAAKWVAGKLPPHYKTWRLCSDNLATYNRNLPLVRLPYPGTPACTLQPDEVTEERWQAVLDRLGIKTIRDVPVTAVRKSRGRKRGGEKEGFGFGS
jgi:DNA polymerase-1